MKTFALSGVIGWDVEARDLRKFLDDAGGDAVEVQVSSPGGFVSHALEMYNLLRGYGGEVTARLSGFAMSAASYIPLAADRVIAEDNAVYMIHNVHGGVFGDHNYILKYGRETESLSRLIGAAYSRRTGIGRDDIARMMDEETYFYGHEIAEAGFADEYAGEDDGDDDRDNMLAMARTALAECRQKMAADVTAAADDLARAVAMAGKWQQGKGVSPGQQHQNTPGATGKEKRMDLAELKKKHPDLVAAVARETVAGLDIETLERENSGLADELRKDGARAEQERIKDVRAQLIPGHEQLISAMELDGKSTGADAAKAIVAAERELRQKAAVALAGQANDPVEPAVPDDGGKKQMRRSEYDALSIEEQRAFVQEGGVVKD